MVGAAPCAVPPPVSVEFCDIVADCDFWAEACSVRFSVSCVCFMVRFWGLGLGREGVTGFAGTTGAGLGGVGATSGSTGLIGILG